MNFTCVSRELHPRRAFRWPDTPAKLAVVFLGTVVVIACGGALIAWIVMTHA